MRREGTVGKVCVGGRWVEGRGGRVGGLMECGEKEVMHEEEDRVMKAHVQGYDLFGYNVSIVLLFSFLLLFQAIFIGHGPAFKKNHVAEGFENIQLYSLMCGEKKRCGGGGGSVSTSHCLP